MFLTVKREKVTGSNNNTKEANKDKSDDGNPKDEEGNPCPTNRTTFNRNNLSRVAPAFIDKMSRLSSNSTMAYLPDAIVIDRDGGQLFLVECKHEEKEAEAMQMVLSMIQILAYSPWAYSLFVSKNCAIMFMMMAERGKTDYNQNTIKLTSRYFNWDSRSPRADNNSIEAVTRYLYPELVRFFVQLGLVMPATKDALKSLRGDGTDEKALENIYESLQHKEDVPDDVLDKLSTVSVASAPTPGSSGDGGGDVVKKPSGTRRRKADDLHGEYAKKIRLQRSGKEFDPGMLINAMNYSGVARARETVYKDGEGENPLIESGGVVVKSSAAYSSPPNSIVPLHTGHDETYNYVAQEGADAKQKESGKLPTMAFPELVGCFSNIYFRPSVQFPELKLVRGGQGTRVLHFLLKNYGKKVTDLREIKEDPENDRKDFPWPDDIEEITYRETELITRGATSYTGEESEESDE